MGVVLDAVRGRVGLRCGREAMSAGSKVSDTAVRRLADALHLPGVLGVHSATQGATCGLCNDKAVTLASADPALAEALRLGLAWEEAEQALPEGWDIWRLQWLNIIGRPRLWQVIASYGTEVSVSGEGPTKVAALNALREALSSPVEEVVVDDSD